MCGLVGIMGSSLTKTDRNIFDFLLWVDTTRGIDSTGVAAIQILGDKISVMKEIGTPDNLYSTYKTDFPLGALSFVEHKDTNILLGHNRFATVGAVEKETAHPFKFDNLVGAHNGTVRMDSLINYDGYHNYNVDSQIIFSHLNKNGDIQEIWDTADGAMALSYYDKVNKTMNFVRNKERPLFLAKVINEYTKKVEKLLWASEIWMLVSALYKYGITNKEIEEVEIDTHYKVSITNEGIVIEKDKLNPFVRKIVSYSNKNSSYFKYFNEHFNNFLEGFFTIESISKVGLVRGFGKTIDGDEVEIIFPVGFNEEDFLKKYNKQDIFYTDSFYTTKGKTFTVTWGEVEHIGYFNEYGDIVSTETFKDYKGSDISLEEFQEVIENDCGVCEGQITFGERNKVIWYDKDHLVCPDCVRFFSMQKGDKFNA